VRVLVIGGSGFIGRFVVEQLMAHGHDVAVFHRGRTIPPLGARSIAGDRHALGEHRSELRALSPDAVVDAVLSSGRQASQVLDVFRGAVRRMVALSSMDVYRACGVLHGSEPGPLAALPLDEDSPLRTKLETYPPAQIEQLQPVFGWLDSEYDKISVERAILGDSEVDGRVIRLPMVYGPGDRLHRFGQILKQMDQHVLQVPFHEAVARWRGTRGYVENVAAAIVVVTEADTVPSRVYNVGDEDTLSELGWAGLIAEAAGWHGDLVVLPSDRAPAELKMPGNLAQHWVADTSRIRRELGYREPIARDESLRRTVASERANRSGPGR
jgi:nucleoside-diphosphate-sugar epimerase